MSKLKKPFNQEKLQINLYHCLFLTPTHCFSIPLFLPSYEKKLCELSISAAKHIATLFIALFENAFRDNKAYKELGPLKLISQALKSWQALSAIVLCVPKFAKTNMSTEMELNASKENHIYIVPIQLYTNFQ